MRHYDLADRSRTKFTGQVDFLAERAMGAQPLGRLRQDDYDDSYFGLQESSFRAVGFGVDYQHPDGLGAGGSYNYEHYNGFQQSRSASPGEQEDDPLRDWTTDSSERVHYFSFYVDAAALRAQHGSAVCLRLRATRAATTSMASCRQPADPAVAVAGGLQQAAGSAARRAASSQRPPCPHGARTATNRRGSSISHSTRASSTASCSRARWSSDTCIVLTPHTRASSACCISGSRRRID